MSATFIFSETNGPAKAWTRTDNIATINFGTVDTPDLGTEDHPIIQGGVSYGKWIQLKCLSLGSASETRHNYFFKSAGDYLEGEQIVSSQNSDGAGFCESLGLYGANNHGVYCGLQSSPRMPIATVADIQSTLEHNPITDSVMATTATTSGAQVATGWGFSANWFLVGYSRYIFLATLTTASTPIGPVNHKTFTHQWEES